MSRKKMGWGVYVQGDKGLLQETWCETKTEALLLQEEWKEEHPLIKTTLMLTDDNQNEWEDV